MASSQYGQRKVAKTPAWWAIGAFFTALVGLRHEVGADWGTYLRHLTEVLGVSLGAALSEGHGDPAYVFVNWLAGILGWGVYGTNTICALLFMSGLLFFCAKQPNPWLALAVSVPYLVIVVAMGYTRQSVAIGLSMFALIALSHGQMYKFAFWVLLAALFHKTAVVLLILPILLSSGAWWWRVPLMGGLLLLAYKALLQDSVESLENEYLVAQYASSGAAIRIAMNALPAVVFLIFINRFRLNRVTRKVWWLLAWAVLLAIPVLVASPSSTAVDRISLYLIPLQIFVWSRVPGLRLVGNVNIGKLLVLSYSASVLFVWLIFADNSLYWHPYNSILLIWLSAM
ncbi:EpsG family protein [Methylovulum psychrotolerans]|uniref:EpsG family protein n=1 Tax=Methylovulum psychrotolerans TaxID=1704499 RepID=UPI001BFFBAAF|nr:EpsG family protein [Methylovulum psychrotolerans]MBT9099550.1 EpsG family protein [Methylovulum psychrotolerans]